MAGDQHHLCIAQQRRFAEQRQAIAIGQVQVQQHQTRRTQRQLLPSLGQGSGHRHLETFGGDERGQHGCGVDIVVNDQG